MAMRILGMALVFSQLLLLLGSPVSSSLVPPPGVDFVEVSCKSSINPALCTATLAPHAKVIKNKPLEAVKLMLALTNDKAVEMTKYLKDLEIRVSHATTGRSQELDYAVRECLNAYQYTSEAMQAVSTQLAQQKGRKTLNNMDLLDAKLMNANGTTSFCDNIMNKVPDHVHNPFKNEFDARRDFTGAKAYISIVWHLFGQLQTPQNTGASTIKA